MPQICDMGQATVLPLRRKGGFEPEILDTRGQLTTGPPKPLVGMVLVPCTSMVKEYTEEKLCYQLVSSHANKFPYSVTRFFSQASKGIRRCFFPHGSVSWNVVTGTSLLPGVELH
jgi:hypothetical protein